MRTVIIGAGMAGMTAALMLAKAGHKVTVVTRGFGGMQLGEGTISVANAEAPLDALAAFPAGHPYAKAGAEALKSGVEAFTGYVPLEGSLEKATVFPTAIGALRRTSLFPASYANGAIEADSKLLLVGLSGMKDFYAKLAAENLVRQGVDARAEILELAVPGGETALAFSRYLDEPGRAEELGRKLGALAKDGEKVGIPAVMREEAFARAAEAAGAPLFQIPTAPPSIAGLEWNETLRAACQEARIGMNLNGAACGLEVEDGKVTAVLTHVAGGVKPLLADAVIYAAGGIDSGAIVRDSYGKVADTVFGLPVYGPDGQTPVAEGDELIDPDYWNGEQGLFACGIGVDSEMRALDASGKAAYPNLYAAGSMVAGAQRARELSGEGVALATAAKAVASILRMEK